MKLLVVLLTLAISFLLLPAISYTPSVLAQTDYGGEFDLNYCQWECRMRYGFEPSGLGGGGGMQTETEGGNGDNELQQHSGTYEQYATCIADCNRKFWQEFDKKTGEIGKKTR